MEIGGKVFTISTHILTRRMTKCEEQFEAGVDISTHILTRRMTIFNRDRRKQDEISTHILTRRMTNRQEKLFFQKIFQLTSSRGG